MQVRTFGRKLVKLLRIEKNKNGRRKNQGLTMLERWGEFTLSIQMIKNIRKFSKTLERKWKDQWHQPCPASGTNSILASWKRMQSRRLAMKASSRQCMVAQWNPTNLRDREQNLCSPKLMRIVLQVKGLLRWHIIIWCTSSSHCHRRWRFRMQRLPRTRNGKTLETIPAWDLGKVKSKEEVILEAQRDKKKAHFASLMDICHLKKCGVGTKASEVQRQRRAPCEHCKRRCWSLHSFHWTGLICIPDDCCKNHGRSCKITRLWWTKHLMQYLRTLR